MKNLEVQDNAIFFMTFLVSLINLSLLFSADGSFQQSDDMRLSHEEQEEDEEENLGRRRGSRRRVQVIRQQPRQNSRPQVGV